jgi:hypothetical protein
MALDFTVIIHGRQRFGDNTFDNLEDLGLETNAPFVGQQKDFEFQCPNVNRAERAILLFQSQGVTFRQPLEINGHQVSGGMPSSVDQFGLTATRAQWIGNVMLVGTGVVREQNVLRIRAIGANNQIDNFIIDNVVIVFKTKQNGGPVVTD